MRVCHAATAVTARETTSGTVDPPTARPPSRGGGAASGGGGVLDELGTEAAAARDALGAAAGAEVEGAVEVEPPAEADGEAGDERVATAVAVHRGRRRGHGVPAAGSAVVALPVPAGRALRPHDEAGRHGELVG